MTIPTDTFHTPGNHVLGAGVVYFSTTDGGAERPIIQTDQLSLQTEVETVSRQDSVDGPRHVDDVEIVSVRRTLIIGTNDVIDKNLGLYFGEFATEDVASASGTKDIASPDAGEWFQITPHPQPLSVSSVATSVELVEGVEYQLDLQRGRIQFLESFLDSTVTVTYEAEGTRVLTVGPKKAVRGQLRFISDPTAGTGYDLFMPSVVLRPSGAIDFKSRSDWMRIGLEIEVLGSILEMVAQSAAVVSSPPVVVTISQSEPLTISAAYSVDVEGATIEFDATRRGGSKEIDIDYAGDPSSFTVDAGDVDVVLEAADTNVTLGTYDGVLKVTDGDSNVDEQEIVIVVLERETLDLGTLHTNLVDTSSATWTPADISLAAWIDPSDSTTVTLSGGEIQQIDDKSGNGNHAVFKTPNSDVLTQGTQNGLDTVSSTDDDARLEIVNGLTATYVAFFVGFTSDDRYILLADSVSSARFLGGADSGSGGNTENTIAVSAYYANGTEVSGSTRGDLHTAFGSAFVASAHSLDLSFFTSDLALFWFASSGGFEYTGDYGDFVLIDEDNLTEEVRHKVEGYLAHKWGLESQLPASHPYKAAAP